VVHGETTSPENRLLGRSIGSSSYAIGNLMTSFTVSDERMPAGLRPILLRMGIVLSAIWFIGFGGYTWFSSMGRLDRVYNLDMQACSENFEWTQNSVNYEYCTEEATEIYRSRFNIYKERIPQLLAMDFGTITASWLAVLLGVVIARFIRRVVESELGRIQKKPECS
jgi:hypothetical protein